MSLLSELIRLDTSNPPGREGLVAELLAPRFRALGFEVDIVPTPEPGKAHFIARLRGDGSKRPVLLAAHADVVGVEREKWTLDPFAGTVRDGFVFGRGALDFKGGLAVFAQAVLRLAERKVPLARDVIFLAEADEENGRYNTTWLAESHWPKIDAEFALNEGGWIIKGADGRVQYVSISTADKSSVPVIVTARGTSTHSSMPRPDSAIFALSRAMARLSAYETDVQLSPLTRRLLRDARDKRATAPLATHFGNIPGNNPALVREADRAISVDPLLHALLRNTFAPVFLNAGFRGNVIPGSAEATINLRLLPGRRSARRRPRTAARRSPTRRSRCGCRTPRPVPRRRCPRPSSPSSIARSSARPGRVSRRRSDAVSLSGRNRCRRLAIAGRAGLRDLSVSHRRRGSDAHARQRRAGQRRIAATGHGDDLPYAGRRCRKVAGQP